MKQFAVDAFHWVSNLEEKSLLHLKPKSAGRKTAEIKSSSLNQKKAGASAQIKQSRIPTGSIFENNFVPKVESN